MKIELRGMDGFTQAQQDLIVKSTLKLEPVINWKNWQDEMAAHRFSETSDSGKKILEKMAKDTIIINVKQFHTLSNTIAYTYLHGTLINLNDYYLNQYVKMNSAEGESNVASTILHEYTHEMGYTHIHRWTRSNSVPYGTQHITARKYMEFYSKQGFMGMQTGPVEMNFELAKVS